MALDVPSKLHCINGAWFTGFRVLCNVGSSASNDRFDYVEQNSNIARINLRAIVTSSMHVVHVKVGKHDPLLDYLVKEYFQLNNYPLIYSYIIVVDGP